MRARRRLVLPALAGAVALVLAGTASPATATSPPAAHGPGELDRTFADDGVLELRWAAGDDDSELDTHEIVVGADGRLTFMGGTFDQAAEIWARVYLAQTESDGTPRAGFAGDGERTWHLRYEGTGTPPTYPHTSGRTLTRLAGGGFLLAGSWTDGYPAEDTQYYLARFRADGRLDRDFGRRGVVHHLVERGAMTTATTEPDGATTRCAAWEDGRVRLWRTLADGAPDRSFGEDGEVRARVPRTVSARMASCTPTAAGGMLVSFVGGDSSPWQMGLLQVTATGERDDAFGSRGIRRLRAPRYTSPYGAVARADGGLLFASREWVDGTSYPAVLAVTAYGRLDRGYGGGDGVAVAELDHLAEPTTYFGTPQLVVDGQGRLVMAGTLDRWPDDPVVFVVRLTPDGSPDASFGVGGGAADPSPGHQFVGSLAVDGSDRPLVGVNGLAPGATTDVIRLLG